MGCGSSQADQAVPYRPPVSRAREYSEHSEPSTSCTVLDYRTDPDGQEWTDEATRNARGEIHPPPKQVGSHGQRHKPQFEFWAHPPMPPSSRNSTRDTKPSAGRNGKGPSSSSSSSSSRARLTRRSRDKTDPPDDNKQLVLALELTEECVK